MSILALIPARAGSKGIPSKNWRQLGGHTLIQLANRCAIDAGCTPVISTDAVGLDCLLRTLAVSISFPIGTLMISRPSELAQDDTPMIDVVKHALKQIPGEPGQIVLLLQPTQPFRTPGHLKQAIALLQETQADSVVSVVELPKTHSPEYVCHIEFGDLLMPSAYRCWATTEPERWPSREEIVKGQREWNSWKEQPTRRQDMPPMYLRDGTCYAFRRATVERYGNIYGADVRPLIIPPNESCELDTEDQWAAVEARWSAKHGA